MTMTIELKEKESRFAQICTFAELIRRNKGNTYHDSWQRRGHVGVFIGGIARKFDRIENIIQEAACGYDLDSSKLPDKSESLLETVMDLFVYAGMWLTLLEKDYPDEFQHLLKANGLDGFRMAPDKDRIE